MDIEEQTKELNNDTHDTKLMSLAQDEKSDKIAEDKKKLIAKNKHKFIGFD